jgi:hypothetical protein
MPLGAWKEHLAQRRLHEAVLGLTKRMVLAQFVR